MTLNGNETLGGPDAWETPITAPKSPEPSSPRLPRNLLKCNHCYHFYFFNEEDLEERESKSSGSFLYVAAFGELAPHDLLWRCRVSSTLRQKANWNWKKTRSCIQSSNKQGEGKTCIHPLNTLLFWLQLLSNHRDKTQAYKKPPVCPIHAKLQTSEQQHNERHGSILITLCKLTPAETKPHRNENLLSIITQPQMYIFATSASNELLSLGHSCSFDIQNNSFPSNWFFKKIFRITTDPKERILRKLSTTNKILLFRGTGRKAASRFIKWYSCVTCGCEA